MLSLKEINKIKSCPFVNKIFHLGPKMLYETIDECKTHGDKKGLGYINKVETPTSGETIFVKGKKEALSHATSFSTPYWE